MKDYTTSAMAELRVYIYVRFVRRCTRVHSASSSSLWSWKYGIAFIFGTCICCCFVVTSFCSEATLYFLVGYLCLAFICLMVRFQLKSHALNSWKRITITNSLSHFVLTSIQLPWRVKLSDNASRDKYVQCWLRELSILMKVVHVEI